MCSRNVSKLGGMLASTMSGSFDEMGTYAMSSVASSYGISTEGSAHQQASHMGGSLLAGTACTTSKLVQHRPKPSADEPCKAT